MTKLFNSIPFVFILISSFLIFSSCEVDSMELPTPEPPVEQVEKLQIVWQVPMGVVDTNVYLNSGVVLAKDKVIATPHKPGRSIVYFWDKNTGDFLFDWDDWIKPTFVSPPVKNIDGQVFGNSESQTFLIDANNGQTLWRSIPINHGEPRTTIALGKFFHTSRDGSPQGADFAYLTTLDNHSGKRDTIVTIPKMNSYEPGMEPPAGWISPRGDSLLIFIVRSLDFGGTLDESLDAYAYNMTADSIEWSLIDFDPDGSARVGPPLVEDDLVYISGVRTLYCLNAGDGSLVWQRRFENDTRGFSETLFISAIIKVGHRLVISPTNSNTYCFDAYTGEELWKETDSASSPQNMVHHEGIIYTVGGGNGKLFAFDLETGEHYWREYPPNRKKDSRALFSNEIALDPETGYIYADDRFFVLCIKPYER